MKILPVYSIAHSKSKTNTVMKHLSTSAVVFVIRYLMLTSYIWFYFQEI